MLSIFGAAAPLAAQDDITTQNASSAPDGAWITGPASNPLSFLNGPAYRTFGSALPYDFPDFHPIRDADERLPDWMNFQTEDRLRAEGSRGGALKPGNNDSYILNRLRIELDLQLGSLASMSLQLQDARSFLQKPPLGPPNQNRWDLKEAYAQFGDPERRWISLRVGRQLINYNNTLIANSEWRNQGRSYDAVLVNLHQNSFRLGIFAASAVVPLGSGISHHQQGNNIYGLYGGIEKLVPASVIEPFVLWRVQPQVALKADPAATARQNLFASGLRWKAHPRKALDTSAEVAIESGSDGPDPIRAWGIVVGAAYQLEHVTAQPRAFAQYDYALGDSHPSDTTHRTFDTLYPTAHDRMGLLDLFGWQNVNTVRAGVTLQPRHRWSLTAQYLDFRLASAKDAAYNSSGSPICRESSGRFGAHLGEEGDLYTWYELNRHVNIGAGFGAFGAGSFVAGAAHLHSSSAPYFAINFKDSGKAEAHR